MRICILTHSFPRNKKDTSAAFMKEFADGLVEAGNKVIVVAPYDEDFKRTKDKFKIVLYKYIWPDSLHLLGYSRAMNADVSLKVVNFILLPFMLLFGTICLIRTIKKEKIDIVNVHWILPNGVMAFAAAIITGTPYVITLPGTDAFLAYKNRAFGLVAKIVAMGSSGLVSNSSWHLKRILALNVREKPTEIISYPTDVSAYKPDGKKANKLRKRLKLTKDNLVIMAIGRLVYKKGFSYLISAMPAVVKRNPKSILIVGGDGDLKEKLITQAKKLGVEKKIYFVGNIDRDEIAGFYNLADVFVAPSIVDQEGNVDGGPVVCYESMACGKPQVVTSVLGVSDIIKDGVNGYVVGQKKPAALAKAVNALLSNKSVREKMGKNNRWLILQTLDTKNVGIRYTGFFNRLLKNESK